jgi:hypothetical protein
MTDDQIGEIYALVREAQNAGQKAVQMQALPFRMTPENLAKHRLDPNIAFWKNLKEGTDYFEVAKDEPSVGVSGGRYLFNGGSTTPEVAEKRRSDESQVAVLVAKGTPAIKLIYDDGDQHSSFKSALIASGSDSLNRSVSWASRDVGVSRPDALTGGPRVVVLDDKGKARTTVRAASADHEAVLAAVAAAASEAAAKPEPAKPAAEPKPAAAPASAATQLAKVSPGAAQPAPVAASLAVAPAPAAEDNRPFYQRALSFVPLIGGASQPAQAAESAPVASVVPATPTSVRAPLPPRRADSLRTSRLDQPAASYSSSQSAIR